MDLGDKKARGVADFVPASNGNDHNSRQKQPERRQDGGKQAGTGRDESRQQQQGETDNGKQLARIDPTTHLPVMIARLSHAERFPVLRRQPHRFHLSVAEDVPGRAGGQLSIPFRGPHLVPEADDPRVRRRDPRLYDYLIIETRRVQIAALRLHYSNHDAIFDLHVPVTEAERLAELDARDLHPD